MNIFITDKCPTKSAANLPTILVNKILQEAIQLLSAAHFVLDGIQRGTKPSHLNHPCSVWCRETSSNYVWVLEHAVALMEEWKKRTGKMHGYIAYLEQVMYLPQNIKDGNLTSFVIAAPDEFKKLTVFGSVEGAYKAYLNAKWKNWATRSDKRKIFVHWSGIMGGENAPDWVCKKLLMLCKQSLLK